MDLVDPLFLDHLVEEALEGFEHLSQGLGRFGGQPQFADQVVLAFVGDDEDVVAADNDAFRILVAVEIAETLVET